MTDGRARNGRQRADLSRFLNTVHGTRTIVAIDTLEEYGGRQFLRFVCTCGSEARYEASTFMRGIADCKTCRGTGVPNGRPVKHSYEEFVGRVINGFRITSFSTDDRPRFIVRCPNGHSFPRYARDVAKAETIRKCAQCSKISAPSKHKAEEYVPEVCNCAWHNGVQRYVCNRHKGAA